MTGNIELPDKRCFRWRIIPAGFLMAFGGVLLLVGTFNLIASLFLLYRHGLAVFGGSYNVLAGIGLLLAAALLLVIAGRLVMNNHWAWMTLTLLVAYAAGVSGSMLMDADEARREANSVAPLVPDRFRTSPADSQSNH